MKTTFGRKWAFMNLLLALALLAPGLAAAETKFGRIVVFGDSLSDPGNAYALNGGENIPPYDDLDKLDALLLPDVPYARGGHHFSNGATWVEQFARPLGLAGNTRPAFQGSSTEATNYAVKGARAHDEAIAIHVNLSVQVNTFLTAFGGAAPSDALYVMEFGGNDIRDALEAFASGGNGGPIIADALTAIHDNIEALYEAGGRKFLVWNTPNLGLTPAVRALDPFTPPPGAVVLAGSLTDFFNSNLDALLGYLSFALPGIEIVQLDVHTKIQDLVDDPAAFGLSVVDTACITPNVPPFECQTPDEYLFWDGLHPTKAVHAIFAHEAAVVLAH